ncbi:bifunctional farnesyl-diphosphate farnesyltransferase/squalene synthase [Ceratobasidium sp. 395]|nr:bifunctional farnesyl-diphosphate farnesyltransferase/squalene synthase [Ceratobasidium sp. 395]
MGITAYLYLLCTHPNEFRSLIQYKLWHDAKRDITSQQEHDTSGWDRESMRKCWHFLDLTSRSFSAVIKELEGDMARMVCMFYLVLRGLDTIEDDMTIPDEKKQPLLRSFHEKLSTPGWTFTESGPDEKDRQLLVEFDNVVTEMGLLKPEYREIITDICHKMEIGMADYAHRAASLSASKSSTLAPNPDAPSPYLESITEYDLYCHYVAGLVGEGLSRLFAASGKEVPWLGEQLTLSNSMGLLLQKTNILRDIREDVDQGRYFWPRELWGVYKPTSEKSRPPGKGEYFGFATPEAMVRAVDIPGEPADRAIWTLSAMTLDALRHATDALDYLALLKNQSVFNFCAIPAVMALATLEVCFMNPDVMRRNVKIRKGQAVQLIMKSTNPRDVAYMFRDFARGIHAKASPADPNFLRIGIACGRIEAWAEHHYPSFITIAHSSATNSTSVEMSTTDARMRIVKRDQLRDSRLKAEAEAKRRRELGLDERKPGGVEQEGLPWALIAVVAALFLGICVIAGAIVYLVIWWSE